MTLKTKLENRRRATGRQYNALGMTQTLGAALESRRPGSWRSQMIPNLQQISLQMTMNSHLENLRQA